MAKTDLPMPPHCAALAAAEHLRPVNRRQVGWHSLRLLAMGCLWRPEASPAALGGPAATQAWLPGPALQVLTPKEAELVQHEASTLALHLRGCSYSRVALMAEVPVALAAGTITHCLAVGWRCQMGAGVALDALHLQDGARCLQRLGPPELTAHTAVFKPVAEVRHGLWLRWDLQFADTERDLRWHDLQFALC